MVAVTASTFHPSFDPDTGLRVRQAFSAPPATLWRAWTDPDLFSRWWGGADTEVSDVALHVGVGGTWQATMTVRGTPVAWSGVYREVVEPSRLVFTLRDKAYLREVVEVDLAPEGEGTLLTLTQAGGTLEEQEYYAIAEGYRQFFHALADVTG